MGKKAERFSPAELASIHSGFKEVETHQVNFEHAAAAGDRLIELWQSDLKNPLTAEPEEEISYRYEQEEGFVDYEREALDLIIREPKWHLGMSGEFTKAIQGIDRKLQGRILEAITYIVSKPMEPKGDTVKPLGGELNGLWRYRIGDYRLVYRPDTQNGRVLLVAFTSRAGAYN